MFRPAGLRGGSYRVDVAELRGSAGSTMPIRTVAWLVGEMLPVTIELADGPPARVRILLHATTRPKADAT